MGGHLQWTRPAFDASLYSGIGLGALGLVAISCRGNGAALGLAVAACVALLASISFYLVATFGHARAPPRPDPKSGSFAPALRVSEELRADAAAAEAAADAEAVAEAEVEQAVEAEERALARTERIEHWSAASKQARRFIVPPEGGAPHPASVRRLRPPRGAFTDIAARVAASVHNPGGELGPVASFSVLKPYAPPDLDGGTTPQQRVAAREQAKAMTPAQQARSRDLARERALDRAMARTLDTSASEAMYENPLLLPLDGLPKPMR